MNRVLKVLVTGAEQERLAAKFSLVERYDGFALLEVPEDQVDELARKVPTEDLTAQYELRIGDDSIDTSTPRLDAKGKERAHPAYQGARKLEPGPHHYLVQFRGPVKPEWLDQVRKAGGDPRTPYAGFVYVVRATEKARAPLAALPCVRWIGHFRHEHRIDTSLLAGSDAVSLPRTRVLPEGYALEFFDAQDMRKGVKAVKALGLEVTSADENAAVAVVRDARKAGREGRLRQLSAVHGVWRIRGLTIKRTSNDVAATLLGTQASLGAGGLGLSGAGEVIAVADTGLDSGNAASIHRDFAGRIQAILSYPIAPVFTPYVTNPGADDGAADLDSGHGTHVTGSVLGDGSASTGVAGVGAPIRGLSHRARLVFQAIEQELAWRNPADEAEYGRYLLAGIPSDLKKLFQDAYDRGARIHSNSWGGGDPGAYDEQCEQLDEFVWNHKDFCVLVANGNDGTDADGDGAINPMSVSSPATAKNCISIGASENLRRFFDSNTYGRWWPRDYPQAPFHDDPMADDPEQVAAFSSRGPTRDGRIKPDLVAPGTYVLSTRSTRIASNNVGWAGFGPSRLYFYMGGTSMATPLAAGAVGLVREYLRTKKGQQRPSAALLKATLVAGATRLGATAGALADNHQGFGRIHLDRVLAPTAPSSATFLDRGQGLSTGEVHTQEIRVASRQAPLRVVLAYSDAPGPNLVNNLNLVLVAPDGTRLVGNQGPGGALTLDARNNVEVVQVANPTPGVWSAQVVGSNVPLGPQDFALVVLGPLGEPASQEDTIELETRPGLEIPDNAPQGVASTLEVTRAGTLASVRVAVDIEHTYIGDLRVILTAPDNRRATLHARSGGSAKDLVRTYDAATTPELGALAGASVRGTWTLSVVDEARIDVGRLRAWQLILGLAEGDRYRGASEPGLKIPDDDAGGVQDMIELSGTAAVREVKVMLDLTHTYVGDLRVTLRSPSGTQVVLHDRVGGSADNLLLTYDAARVPNLRFFAGETAQGTWTLHVADLAGRDVGKLNRWELQVTPE